MRQFIPAFLLALTSLTYAQQDPAAPDPSYTPPTHGERFRTYLSHTYSPASLLEAGARAGIDQARHQPSEWPEGAEGYGERLGSVAGHIMVRGTTQYALGELFREDLRRPVCPSCSPFRAALEDTFLARKGSDGHAEFSFARLLGPISAGAVASAWMPGSYRGRTVLREATISYGFVFVRNLVRELKKR